MLDGEARDRRQDDDRRAMDDRRALESRRRRGRQTPGKRKGSRRWSRRRAAIASTISDGVGLYWRYEKQIRRDESATGSVVGATGAIYAMRRSLWQPLPHDTILDDVLTPMRCVMAGYRVVFEERACAFDRTAPDANAEGRRKLRTLAGNYQLLWLEPRLLLPWRNPLWLQFVSHKVGRLLVAYALPPLFCSACCWRVARLCTRRRSACNRCSTCLPATERGSSVHATRPASRSRSRSGPCNRLARIALTFFVMNKSAVGGLVAHWRRNRRCGDDDQA